MVGGCGGAGGCGVGRSAGLLPTTAPTAGGLFHVSTAALLRPAPHRCITPHLATTLAHPIRITARPIVRINMGTDMGTTATTMSVAMVGIVVAITAVVEGAHNHALVLVARSASA